jgi:hypothetical protein
MGLDTVGRNHTEPALPEVFWNAKNIHVRVQQHTTMKGCGFFCSGLNARGWISSALRLRTRLHKATATDMILGLLLGSCCS